MIACSAHWDVAYGYAAQWSSGAFWKRLVSRGFCSLWFLILGPSIRVSGYTHVLRKHLVPPCPLKEPENGLSSIWRDGHLGAGVSWNSSSLVGRDMQHDRHRLTEYRVGCALCAPPLPPLQNPLTRGGYSLLFEQNLEPIPWLFLGLIKYLLFAPR